MAIGSKNLRASRLLDAAYADEDPMGGLGNLMDVMLVFACGLLVALIGHYNVDFSGTVTAPGDVQPVDSELLAATEGIADNDATFVEEGTVYRDVETGELYMVTPEGDD